jgi:hypothetical protein
MKFTGKAFVRQLEGLELEIPSGPLASGRARAAIIMITRYPGLSGPARRLGRGLAPPGGATGPGPAPRPPLAGGVQVTVRLGVITAPAQRLGAGVMVTVTASA